MLQVKAGGRRRKGGTCAGKEGARVGHAWTRGMGGECKQVTQAGAVRRIGSRGRQQRQGGKACIGRVVKVNCMLSLCFMLLIAHLQTPGDDVNDTCEDGGEIRSNERVRKRRKRKFNVTEINVKVTLSP